MMLQDSSGRLRLESKDAMKRRGIQSPDQADALALACYPSGVDLHGGLGGSGVGSDHPAPVTDCRPPNPSHASVR